MKKQVLTRKNIVSVFTALLFIYGIHGVGYAELTFTEGETATREITENTAAGTNIGEPLRYSSDSCTSVRLRGSDTGSFDLVRVFRGVQLKTKSTLDHETKNSYEVRVTISGAGNSDTITVIINVMNVNEAPMFAEANSGTDRIQRSIPESTTAGTNIGDPVSAIDPDGSDNVLTYNLDGVNAGMFGIDSNTGQLRTDAPLDYEAFESEPRAYFISVRAFDGTMSAQIDVRIDVEPVNEFAPMFIEGNAATREIHEKEAVGANVGEPVSATDEDMGDILVYSLSDADLDVFEINSSTGQLRTKAVLDYETKPAYTMKVLASDGSQVDSIIVTVHVLAEEQVASAPTMNRNRTDFFLDPAVLKTSDRETLQSLLHKFSVESDGSLKYQRAIALLERALASMHPDKTVLMANYPNPFNPETWIPYHLAKATDVQITIYNMHGIVVRNLELGHLSAGYYMSRSQSAYWDGKNAFGEPVASGIYFYQLQADTVSPLRKMVILK